MVIALIDSLSVDAAVSPISQRADAHRRVLPFVPPGLCASAGRTPHPQHQTSPCDDG